MIQNEVIKPVTRIFCDFDGTITRKDSGDEFFRTFGQFNVLHDGLMKGEYSVSEYYKRICSTLNITSNEALHMFCQACEVDAYFSQFLEFVHSKNWECMIVSDGFDKYIQPILQRCEADSLIVQCNVLNHDEQSDKWIPSFPNADERCACFCASCKTKIVLSSSHPDDMIIYIGDGLSDTCPVHVADMIFAKGSLAAYCNQHGIIHHNWNSFFDIVSVLKKRSPVLRDIARKERKKIFIAE